MNQTHCLIFFKRSKITLEPYYETILLPLLSKTQASGYGKSYFKEDDKYYYLRYEFIINGETIYFRADLLKKGDEYTIINYTIDKKENVAPKQLSKNFSTSSTPNPCRKKDNNDKCWKFGEKLLKCANKDLSIHFHVE